MMPDLGAYAVPVLSAYAGSIFLLIVLIAGSIWKARRVMRKLSVVEERRGKG